MDRRIAAIFVADMVGSTRLMERDERDVITRHKAHLAEVFEPEFAARRGRVIKGTGDGLIGVFDSVVDALEGALAIQNAMAEREAKGERQIAYRIAIHLGDVMFEEDDVYGDGVNIAARLEGEAAPGGIVVSGAVHDFAHKQLAVGFNFMGEQKVKSIEEPVKSYSVNMVRRNAPPEEDPPEPIRFREEDAFSKVGKRADRWHNWLLAQPKGVQRAAFMIVFFFAINLLFSGIATPWFIFPSLPFALYILRHVRKQRQAERTEI